MDGISKYQILWYWINTILGSFHFFPLQASKFISYVFSFSPHILSFFAHWCHSSSLGGILSLLYPAGRLPGLHPAPSRCYPLRHPGILKPSNSFHPPFPPKYKLVYTLKKKERKKKLKHLVIPPQKIFQALLLCWVDGQKYEVSFCLHFQRKLLISNFDEVDTDPFTKPLPTTLSNPMSAHVTMRGRLVKLSAEANMRKLCVYRTCKSESQYPEV